MTNTIRCNGVDYNDNTIKTAQIARSIALDGRALDVDTMTATIQSTSDLSQSALNASVPYRRSGSPHTRWSVTSVTRVAPQLWTLSMISPLGKLAQMPHKGGIYNGVSAYNLLFDLTRGSGISWAIDQTLEHVLLYGYLPYVSPSGDSGAMMGSAKDNLLKVLFALNASVSCSANGLLSVQNLPTTVSSVIDADRIYRDDARVIYDSPVTSVTVLEHQYISGGDLTTLFEGTTTANQIVVFREPMSDLSATGFSVVESGANYAIVSAGTGTLTGRKYVHTTREITRAVTSSPVTNPVRVEDATLVSITNSGDVADRLADYYAHRTRIECDAIVDFEAPGDVISIYDPFDKVMRNACIEKISPINVSRTLKGRVSALVGYTPWQTEPFEDVRELLTGTGTWTVPAGVYRVTAVLIGGGQGGREGNQGGAPEKIGVRSYADQTSLSLQRGEETTHEITTDNAGDGGLPGEPGSGGKIYRGEISVTPGQQLSYSCGIGGLGASYGSSAQGYDGTATLLDIWSSNDGASSQSGFFDPVSGATYGAIGAQGLAGGKGCSYGDQTPQGVEFGGVLYTPGANSIGDQQRVSDSSNAYGSMIAICYSAFGGGAAAGANGSPGEYCSLSVYAGTSTAYARAYPKSGGAGGDAQKPPKETVYGKGGTGGNGGGGRGDYNRARAYNSYNPTDNPRAPGATTVSVAEPLHGGNGSDGGDGADGCIILYYRRQIT